MIKNFHGHKLITVFTLITLLIGLVLGCVTINTIMYETHIPESAYICMIFWLSAAIVFSIISLKEFVTGYLFSLFCMMIAWRISGIYDVVLITYPLFFSFLFMLSNFVYCAWDNIKNPANYLHKLSIEQWQLVFIRLYIGYDFIPHFTEKLFAGSLPRMQDVNAFMYLGVPHAEFFVWLAGLCEFGAAIALSLGLLMRIGAVGAAIYLMIATYLGHHFSLGFIWAGPGGGWEFATMWIILILCFAVTGAHEFSVDQRLEDTFKLPAFIRRLM